MAVRASNALAPTALNNGKALAWRIKQRCQAAATEWAASGASADAILSIIRQLVEADAQFNTLVATPGLVAYAQEYENDGSYDVVAEFQALRGLMTTLYNGLMAAIPTDGTYALIYSVNGSGNLTARTFTAGQLATHITNLQAVADAVT